MKITIPCQACSGSGKITRTCCQNEDLKVHPEFSKANGMEDSIAFCRHCGNIFIETKMIDAAGSNDYYFAKITKEQLLTLISKTKEATDV